MPSHTINKLLTPTAHPHHHHHPPPAWLPPAHTSSTCGKKFSCMLQYIRPRPCCEAGDWLQRRRAQHRIIFREANGNMPGPLKIWLVCQECWMQTTVFQQADRGRKTGAVRPFIRNQVRQPRKSWCTGTVFPPLLKRIVLGWQHWVFDHSLYNYTKYDFRPQLCPSHEWDLTSSSPSECRDFSHMATVNFFFSFEAIFTFPARYDGAV